MNMKFESVLPLFDKMQYVKLENLLKKRRDIGVDTIVSHNLLLPLINQTGIDILQQHMFIYRK